MIPNRAFQRTLAAIRKHGVGMTIYSTEQQPSTIPGRTDGPGVTVENKVKGVMLQFDLKLVDGTTIKETDRQILVAGLSLDAAILDGYFVVDGTTSRWAIRGCREVSPDGRPILYKFHVRK